MKRVKIYIKLAVIATAFLASCETKEWDPADELSDLAYTWAHWYVGDIHQYAVDTQVTLDYYSEWPITLTSNLKDTISIDIISNKNVRGDSTNVITSLRQIKDSIIVTTDGYKYSDKFWAHLYTVGPGIINYEGIFHVDFYENGKDTPWAWSEVTCTRDYNRYDSSSRCIFETHTYWY